FIPLPLWGPTPFTTPMKPLFIPFSWGWWFGLTVPLLVAPTGVLSRACKRVPPTLLALLVTLPLFSAYEIYAESTGIAKAWWEYDLVLKPMLHTAKGDLTL